MNRIVFLTMCSLCVAARSQAQVDPYRLKAAFLVSFTKYVEWPSGSGDPKFVIGVVGDDPFNGELQRAAKDKTVNGRKIVVERLKWSNADSADLLFVPQSESGNLGGLQKLAKQPILTVGESSGFVSASGMIGFQIINQKVSFEINASVARAAGINISSQLLRLASSVK